MTTYRVEVDGETVWTDETDGYQGAAHFGEYLNRAVETPVGEAHNSPAHLYVDDVLIGVQASHGAEADDLHAAADAALADPNVADRDATLMRLDAFAAQANAADALGDPVAAAQHRADRALAIVEAVKADPTFANHLAALRS